MGEAARYVNARGAAGRLRNHAENYALTGGLRLAAAGRPAGDPAITSVTGYAIVTSVHCMLLAGKGCPYPVDRRPCGL
jgi:hypothetical protein